MLGSSYKIATIWGIPIKIHISLIILIALMAISSITTAGLDIMAKLDALMQGLLLAVCIFTSIALHELGHSFVAIRKGCRVREITLMFIGGAAQMERIPTRPRDELQMALAGPLVSIVLGIVCWFAGSYIPLDPSIWPIPFINELTREINFVQYLGVWNLWIAAFNLLPSFPMDGGRVVRALLTRKLGRLRATEIAAKLGKIMSVGFFVVGGITGDWVLFIIAFFIYISAGQEYRIVQMEEAAKNSRAGPWAPFGTFWTTSQGHDDPEDKVIISPPSYRNGPDSEADLRTLRKRNPFSDLFGQ